MWKKKKGSCGIYGLSQRVRGPWFPFRMELSAYKWNLRNTGVEESSGGWSQSCICLLCMSLAVCVCLALLGCSHCSYSKYIKLMRELDKSSYA